MHTTKRERELRRTDLIEPELSYRVVGILFDVFDQLESGYRERTYQQAVEAALDHSGIAFQKQVRFTVHYRNIVITKRIIDFVIENKMVLELKASGRFRAQDYQQVKEYLKTTGLSLALLVRFGTDGVHFYRVLRPKPSPTIRNFVSSS